MLRNRMIYKTLNKKSLLAKGGLCKIKLCQNVARDLVGVDDECPEMSAMYGPSNTSQQYAIKRFNKLTLRKNK